MKEVESAVHTPKQEAENPRKNKNYGGDYGVQRG